MSEEKGFAEKAFEMGGKSQLESKAVGTVDKADDQVEALFSENYKTKNSPINKAIWNNDFSLVEKFAKADADYSKHASHMKSIVSIVKSHMHMGILDKEGKISKEVINDLTIAGYWGLLIDLPNKPAVPFVVYSRLLEEIATIHPMVAGMGSIHSCIGAVDPLKIFGNEEQKNRLMPELYHTLSAFALTEPGAGSDLTAIKTIAAEDGEDLLITGTKLFISNPDYNRYISLVCKLNGKPIVVVAKLPETDTNNFKIIKYGLYPLRQINNVKLEFNNFRVSKKNIITPINGDGLTVAYHGLNLGRVALCANAVGCMRRMMVNLAPWIKYRITYGQPIENREFVQFRIAKLAAYIVCGKALVEFCSKLLDAGYRGELECVIAKIFGSEMQADAAIKILMKTHGGRSFLHGHLFGDNIHDFLAPLIYEGEGDMLRLAFFKSMVKDHGETFMAPIGERLAAEVKRKNKKYEKFSHFENAWFLLKNIGAIIPYLWWKFKKKLPAFGGITTNCGSNKTIIKKNIKNIKKLAPLISSDMAKHKMKFVDRQLIIAEWTQKTHAEFVSLITNIWAATNTGKQKEFYMAAARVLSGDLFGMTNKDKRFAVEFGQKVIEDSSCFTDGIDIDELLMEY